MDGLLFLNESVYEKYLDFFKMCLPFYVMIGIQKKAEPVCIETHAYRGTTGRSPGHPQVFAD